MTDYIRHQPDPKLDLVLERTVDIPPHEIFAAWTRPELITQWFTPAPWTTIDAEVDLRPGGIFRTVMRSPEGEEFPGTGCVLEVVENRKFVWTGALQPGFRPRTAEGPQADHAPFVFTGLISLEPHGTGTKYTAIAIHGDEEGCAKHSAMGFHAGWGAALDQLVAMVKARTGGEAVTA